MVHPFVEPHALAGWPKIARTAEATVVKAANQVVLRSFLSSALLLFCCLCLLLMEYFNQALSARTAATAAIKAANKVGGFA